MLICIYTQAVFSNSSYQRASLYSSPSSSNSLLVDLFKSSRIFALALIATLVAASIKTFDFRSLEICEGSCGAFIPQNVIEALCVCCCALSALSSAAGSFVGLVKPAEIAY